MPRPSRRISTTFLMAVLFALAITGRPDPQGALALSTATIESDRPDYQPFTQVTLTGSGWLPGETVSMLFHETGQTPDQYTDPDFVLTTVAYSDGTIYYTDFWTDWHDVGVTFTVTATGLTSGSTAQTSFTDAAAGDLDQCANGGNIKPWNLCTASDTWQNGNLGQNDSHYYEGDSVAYRLRLSGLDTAASHTVTIEWDAEKSANHHAIDYLTDFNRTVTGADFCAGVSGCSMAAATPFPIPLDDHVKAGFDGVIGTSDDIVQMPNQNFYMWGATISSVSVYTMNDANADSPTRITLTFTAGVSNPVLAWGGHIATRADWGIGGSAIAIQGSPYHMRFIDLDGKGGNQDRSLSTEAVFFPIQLTIVKQTNPDEAPSTAFNFTTTGSFATSLGGIPTSNPSFTLTPPNGTTSVSKIFYLPDETARTVTESDPSPDFALSNLVCQQTSGGLGTGTVTTDIPARTASITPKEGEYITCTFTNNMQMGSIKVVKATVPSGSSQSFSFTATGTGFAGSFNLTDGQDHTVGSLLPGKGYTVSETVPSGWDQTSATCDHGSIGAIEVIANTTTTCTFTNTQQSQLRIEKVTVPDGDTTDFTFTPANWNSGSTFTRRDNQGAFASGYLTPGATNYDAVETVPSGWALTDRACVLTGTATPKTFTSLTNGVRVNLAAGEDVTCSFTDTKQSQLRIEKVTLPDGDTTDFTFTPANWNSGATFTRHDNQPAFTSGYLAPGATNYDAVETLITGYDLTDRACVLTGTATSKTFSSLTNGVRVNLAAGEDVTCTFTNTKRAQLHIIKSTVPDGDTTDFTFTPANWNSDSTFTRRDNQAAFDSGYLVPGATNYDTVETVATGYELTDRACVLTGTATSKTFSSLTNGVRVNLAAGEDVTCTFTNTKQAQLHIVKSTVPDGDTTDFTFTAANWNSDSTFTRRDNQAAFDSGYLVPGATNYDTVETVATGYELTDRACVLTGTATSKTFSSLTNGVRVNLAAGEDVTCTFTNTKQAQLRIEKVTLPDADATDFTFTPDNWNGNSTFTRHDNQAAFASGYLTPGATNYDAVETVVAGYELTNRTCVLTGTATSKTFASLANGVRVNLAVGEDVTCTFTNTKLGTIIVEKQTLPDGTAGSFSFTGDAAGSISDNGQIVASGLLPGIYASTEADPTPGFDLTSVVCDDANSVGTVGTRSASFHLEAGETVKCTFTNTKRAHLRIEKVTLPDGDTTDFTFTPANWNSNSTFTRRDNQAAFDSGYLVPGATNYDAVETVATGYQLTDRACVLTGTATPKTFSSLTNGVRVNLAAGEDVTCTFTNTKQAQLRVEKVTLPDGDTTDFTFTPANWNSGLTFTRRDNQAALASGDLVPGATNYDAVETVPAGWALTGRACVLTGTATPKTFSSLADGVRVNLAAGEDVTCTFTNTKQAQLHIVKATVPDGNATDFTFTPANWNSGSTFTRRDNQAAFNSGYLTPGATDYDTVETVPTGWALTDRACVRTGSATPKTFSSLTDGVRLNLAAGEDVTCTFTNTQQSQLRIAKVTLPDGDSTDFTFTPANWNGGTTFTRHDNQPAFNSGYVAPGATNYDAVESVPSGWALTGRACVLTGTATVKAFTTVSDGVRVNLAAGEDVTCTFTDTKLATLIVEKQTNPDGATGTFAFTGTAAGSISDNGQIVVSGLMPGAYSSTEADPTPNFDLTSISCDDGNSTGNVSTRTASFNLEAGETVKCTFTNRQRGLAKVIKTFNGQPLSGTDSFTFQLRSGASAAAAGTTLETLTANASNGGELNFTRKLVPGDTYQMCEQMQAGWLTTLGPPLYSVFNPSGDNSVVCTDFTVAAGETKTFTINNQPPPGGMSLTIGYWKNWASCANSNGKQAPMLDRTVNLRTMVYGITKAEYLTDTDANVNLATDCAVLVNLLNKLTISGGKKMASDPIFNMIAQLVAADLNALAGAGLSVNGVAAVNKAHALLTAIHFDGTKYDKLSPSQIALANCLATALDQSNNNKLVQSCP